MEAKTTERLSVLLGALVTSLQDEIAAKQLILGSIQKSLQDLSTLKSMEFLGDAEGQIIGSPLRGQVNSDAWKRIEATLEVRGPLNITALSKASKVHKRYARNILCKQRRQGIVSCEGRFRGARWSMTSLNRQPEQLTMH